MARARSLTMPSKGSRSSAPCSRTSQRKQEAMTEQTAGMMPPVRLRLRNGVCRQLEDIADALIAQSLVGVTSRTAKSDILTKWKEEDRARREILTSTGFADPAVRKGMFRKAW